MRIHSKLMLASTLLTLLFLIGGIAGLFVSRDIAHKSLLLDRIHELVGIHSQIKGMLYQATSTRDLAELEENELELQEYYQLFAFGLTHLQEDLAGQDLQLDEDLITGVTKAQGKISTILQTHRSILMAQKERAALSDILTQTTGAEKERLLGKQQELITQQEQAAAQLFALLQEFQEWTDEIELFATEFPDEIRETLQRLESETVASQLFFLIFIAMSLLTAFGISLIFTRLVYRPIQKLITAVHKVEEGNLDVSVDVSSNDELGLLVKAFNSMAINLKAQTDNLQRARFEAEEASQAKSRFLGCMSHELRTPLNAVIGYSELIREVAEERNDPELVKDIERITRSGLHLLQLINTVLDLERIGSDKLELDLRLVNIQELLEDLQTTVQPLARNNGNSVIVENLCADREMVADHLRIKQVLINLVGNAVKFTENGEITLTAADTECCGKPAVSFTVQDTGIGMKEDDLERVFEAFTQVDSRTTREYDGTGLGLTITRELIQMMGGYITVDSELGKGSTFTVTIPTRQDEISKEFDGGRTLQEN